MSPTASDAISATQVATEAMKLVTALVLLSVAIIPLLKKKAKRAKKKAVAQTETTIPNRKGFRLLLVLQIVTTVFALFGLMFLGNSQTAVSFVGLAALNMVLVYLFEAGPASRGDNVALVVAVGIAIGFQIAAWMLNISDAHLNASRAILHELRTTVGRH